MNNQRLLTRTAALLAISALGLSACTTTDNPVAGVATTPAASANNTEAPKASYDTGDYTYTYAAISEEPKARRSASPLIQSSILGEQLVQPYELDDRLAQPQSALPIISLNSLTLNLGAYFIKSLPDFPEDLKKGVEAGFLLSSATGGDFTDHSTFYTYGTTIALRMAKPDYAQQVANIVFDSVTESNKDSATILDGTGPSRMVVYTNNDHRDEGFAVTVHNEFVLIDTLISDTQDTPFPALFKSYTADFVEKQTPALDNTTFHTNIYGYGGTEDYEPIDPTGILALAIPTSQKQLDAGYRDARYGSRLARIALSDLSQHDKLAAKNLTPLEGARRGTLVFKYATATAAQKALTDTRADYENPTDSIKYTPYDEPQGIPDTTCQQTTGAIKTTFTCQMAFDNYTAEGTTDSADTSDNAAQAAREDLSHMMAAQYELFTQAKQQGALN